MSKCQQGRPTLTSIFLIFFLPVILFSCALKEQYNLKSPSALEDPHIWDFGQVREGSSLEHAFILKNTKDRPLTITSMNTSCGCTVSETQKKQLLPGEYTRINVKFHTQGYSGRVQQHVYVHTDDAAQSIIKFSVMAEVVK
jgi:hypothetical protein